VEVNKVMSIPLQQLSIKKLDKNKKQQKKKRPQHWNIGVMLTLNKIKFQQKLETKHDLEIVFPNGLFQDPN